MKWSWGLIAAVAWLPMAAQEAAKLPSFEVATIRPVDPKKATIVGFLSQPGGRVEIGFATVKMLAYYAFDVQERYVVGGADWVGMERELRFGV